MTGGARHHLFASLLAGCCALVVLIAAPAFGQSSDDARRIDNTQYNFSVMLSAECRYEEGPGTLDATCSPDIEQGDSRAPAGRLSVLSLQISAETVPGDAGKTPTDLAQQYTEAMFRAELPEAVCGESDSARAKVQDVKATPDETRLVYTADVICSGVRFLQVPQRTAIVRHIIAPTGRYRLVARSTSEDLEKQKAKVEAFFSSFAITPPAK
jgi:hypothetical protein